MIKHSFKLIWNQKRKNTYIILELFILFIILLISTIYLIERYEQYSMGVGADINNTFFLQIVKKDGQEENRYEQLMKMKEHLESLEDIEVVSYSKDAIPYIGSMWMNTMSHDSVQVGTVIRKTDENFRSVFRINVIEGEWITNEYKDAYPPIVIDKQAAEELFESPKDAIGKIVEQGKEYKVTGVYDMFRRNDFETNYPSCFIPFLHSKISEVGVVIRYKEGVMPETSKLSQIIFTYFEKENFSIQSASTMLTKKEERNSETNIEIFLVGFFSVFLIINMILGMIGIFGYDVKRRISELGIRRALGSSAQKLHLLLLMEAWSLTLIALIPAFILVIQIPILELYPIELGLFIKAILLSTFMIFFLVSISVLYPAYLASLTQAAEALQEE